LFRVSWYIDPTKSLSYPTSGIHLVLFEILRTSASFSISRLLFKLRDLAL